MGNSLSVNEIDNVDENVIYDLKMFLEMYIKKFIEDEYEVERLMEFVEMKKDLFHSTVDTFRNQGKRKTERKFVRDLIDNDFKLEDISNIFGLDEDYILDLLQ